MTDFAEQERRAGPPPGDRESKPSGPAAAVILAAGIASLGLGLMTTLAEADEGIADTLAFDASVGPLMGKTVVTIITFFFFWPALSALLWRRDPPLKLVTIAAGALIALGFLMTFPKFFELFAA